jgi:hypothetical protein
LNKLPSPELTREQFRKVLLEQQGESSIWPRDEDFQKAWLEKPVFESLGAARIQWVLRQLEQQLTPEASQNPEGQSVLYVEHIMPQDWILAWPLPNGKQGIRWFQRSNEMENKDEIEASNLRDRLKHSFGNLTLLKQPLSTAVSNATFTDKKAEILANSTFGLDQALENISQRGSRLFEIARRVWPHGQ